jgi:DNA invertase Pin-like site-specific DNA recombinase
VDSGVSAYRGQNQAGELGRLVEILQAGDTLLVEDADRLSRQDWKAAMDFVERVLAKGVKIVTLQNGNEITAESFRSNPGVFLQLILKYRNELFTEVALGARTVIAHISDAHTAARLICSGAGKGRNDCSFRGAPLALLERPCSGS